MGTESVAEYCREIEAYLCRKNDGHLIRVVGPSFDRVSGWAARGVPLKVAFEGIDRYFERYYRGGSRRRPVKIDFCEADVLDVFDEWRRALGVAPAGAGPPGSNSRSHPSLASHLERAVLRLTAARASGAVGAPFDALIDRVAAELDAARAKAGGVRGEARQAAIERLAALDADMLELARGTIGAERLSALTRDAEQELEPYRATMMPDAFARARAAAVDRLVRQTLGLPAVVFFS